MATAFQDSETRSAPTAIGALTIKGELTASEDLTIDGVFEGSIDLRGHTLLTSSRSQVHAAVSARVVTVHGKLEGYINADVVDIVASALVDANVITKKLALEEGAQFNGSVNTERARAAGEVARHRFAQRR
jgi:cytoskeletal protein CcmA (bactofilin family)